MKMEERDDSQLNEVKEEETQQIDLKVSAERLVPNEKFMLLTNNSYPPACFGRWSGRSSRRW